MSEWQKILEKRKANIGFLTRSKAFGEPTPGEKAAALVQEINSWQNSKGKKTFTISTEYSTPKGAGINLLRTREPGGRLDGPEYTKAIDAYVLTPIDHYEILKAQGIDVSKYEKPLNFLQKMIEWFKKKINTEYEPPATVRYTKEFIEMMTPLVGKEKK